jgi:ribosomal protein S18 acetylase RimI-like enzyme
VRDAPAALEVRHPGLRLTAANAIEIRPLTADTWDALAELFREGGDPRWCWCQFWRLRSKDFGAFKVPQLRARLHDQARSDQPPGLVAFDGGRAVGWVSLGPRADFERIVRSKVIPAIDDRPVWSIVCFAVSSSARGRGVARALLEGAVAYAREQGAKGLEAYPVRAGQGDAISPESAFTGTLPMFERAGFRVVADRASDPAGSNQRVVVRRQLRRRRSGRWGLESTVNRDPVPGAAKRRAQPTPDSTPGSATGT